MIRALLKKSSAVCYDVVECVCLFVVCFSPDPPLHHGAPSVLGDSTEPGS